MAATHAMVRQGATALVAPRTKRRGKDKEKIATWKLAVGGIVGGAVGAVGGALLTRAAVPPLAAAAIVTIGGGAGAIATKGIVRAASIGAGAAGAGQLVLVAWGQLAEKKREEEEKKREAAGPARQLEGNVMVGAPPAAVKDANSLPRQGLAHEDDDLMRAFSRSRAQAMAFDEAQDAYRQAA